MIRKLNDERGLAMITGIMVSLVVLIFSIAVVDLSAHNMRSSDRDRKRVDAIGTAEAGMDATMSAIQTAVIDVGSGTYTLPCTVTATLPQAPSSKYTVTVNYSATYPPTWSPMACPPTTAPAAMTLTSVGNAVTNSPTSVTRTMEAQARLTPVYGQIGGNAIFSDSGLDLENQLTVNGNAGNDGNLYTNGNFTCNNNSTIAGSLLVQGTVTLQSSCRSTQDGTAKRPIPLT